MRVLHVSSRRKVEFAQIGICCFSSPDRTARVEPHEETNSIPPDPGTTAPLLDTPEHPGTADGHQTTLYRLEEDLATPAGEAYQATIVNGHLLSPPGINIDLKGARGADLALAGDGTFVTEPPWADEAREGTTVMQRFHEMPTVELYAHLDSVEIPKQVQGSASGSPTASHVLKEASMHAKRIRLWGIKGNTEGPSEEMGLQGEDQVASKFSPINPFYGFS
jgi:hypothetical protein